MFHFVFMIYQHGSSHIWWGATGSGPGRSYVTGSDVILPEVTWPDVTLVTRPEVCSAYAQPVPAPFSYYSSSAKCTIAHDRHGYRKWRDRRSHDPEVVPLEGCAHLQPEVAQYPPLVGPFPPGKYTSAHARSEVP